MIGRGGFTSCGCYHDLSRPQGPEGRQPWRPSWLIRVRLAEPQTRTRLRADWQPTPPGQPWCRCQDLVQVSGPWCRCQDPDLNATDRDHCSQRTVTGSGCGHGFKFARAAEVREVRPV